jgi:HD-like signal output (HDOD) protein
LAKKSGKVDRGAAYTAALLRRLGWFTLATLAPADVVSLISAGEAARCDEERKRFGISHLDAGALTASRWRFPEALLAAVSSPEEVKPSRANALLAVACVAATLVERGAAEGAGCLSHMPHHLTTLGLDAATAFEEVRKVIEG